MRLGELAQRVTGRRAKRRATGEAPREIVPADPAPAPAVRAPADPFDAARERLKARIPPPADDD